MLEQERAAYALNCIQRTESSHADKYLTQIRRLPAMVLINGLGQAIAFLLSEGSPASKKLFEQIEEWIVRRRGIYDSPTGDRHGSLLKLITSGSRQAYLSAQDEALALLGWLKRFGDAFLERENKEPGEVKA